MSIGYVTVDFEASSMGCYEVHLRVWRRKETGPRRTFGGASSGPGSGSRLKILGHQAIHLQPLCCVLVRMPRRGGVELVGGMDGREDPHLGS